MKNLTDTRCRRDGRQENRHRVMIPSLWRTEAGETSPRPWRTGGQESGCIWKGSELGTGDVQHLDQGGGHLGVYVGENPLSSHLRSVHLTVLYLSKKFSKAWRPALLDMAQWIERWPANYKVASLTPSQGTCLGCRPGPQ